MLYYGFEDEMLRKFFATIFFMMIVSLTGCGGGGGGDSAVNRTINEPASGWTIMVWLDADNNLESAAMQDLNEMEYGLYLAGLGDSAVTDKVKIIVQVDRYGSASSPYTGDNWSDTRRYIIRPDSANITKWTSQRIDNDLGEINMGDAGNLRNFIDYCQEHFPAPNYALILWNHGGGLRKKSSSSSISGESGISSISSLSKAICWDDTNGDDALYTGEITDVLTDIHSVDFLGFDACLMGMLEVAYEYRPGVTGKFGADAISFSPANEQGDGWNYERILNRLKGSGTDTEGDVCYNADSLTANQFATLVAKEYADDDSTYSDDKQTQTAVDNTKVVALKTAFDAFAVACKNSKTELESVRGSGTSVSTMHYFNETDTGTPSLGILPEWISRPFFDLYDFAERMYNNNDIADTAATNLMTAINNFILYSYAGSSYSGFSNGQNGLSFFFTDGDEIYSYSGVKHLAYQWWYTSVDSNIWWPGGHYYGKLDFCDGDNDSSVETWFELIMYMYHTGDYDNFHPGPAF